jgi:vacuolar-type H+-ATPase subunit D/Vma8
MERRYELETLRRSLAMLRPGAPALDREEAMRLVRELQAFERQVRTLRQGLLQLLDEAWPATGPSAQRNERGGVGQDLADGGQEA